MHYELCIKQVQGNKREETDKNNTYHRGAEYPVRIPAC